METGNNFDYERFKEEAIQGLSEGKKWGGADGVFGPMLQRSAAAAPAGIDAGGRAEQPPG